MQEHLDHDQPDRFPTDPSGLLEATRPAPLELGHGDATTARGVVGLVYMKRSSAEITGAEWIAPP